MHAENDASLLFMTSRHQKGGKLANLSAAFKNTVVIFLKATKAKSQNRISQKQQQFSKNDKSESFLDFYLVYKYVYLKGLR